MLNLSLVVFLQIVLESLPVSSSGHIALLEVVMKNWGGLKNFIGLPCYKSLELFLHIPSSFIFFIFTIIFLRKIWNLFSNNYFQLFSFIFLADFITALIYLFLKRNIFPLWVGFCITALIIVFSSLYKGKSNNELSLKKSLILGFFQGISLLPGVSRLALTFFVGRLVGFSKDCSLFISFGLAIPLFIGGGLKGFYRISKHAECYDHIFNKWFAISIVLASLLAFLLLVCLKWLIENDKYWIFAVYLTVPILISFFFALGM